MQRVVGHTRMTPPSTVMTAVAGLACIASGCGRDADSARASDHRNAEYAIDGHRVALIDGRAETPAAPGSASTIVTRLFGNEVRHDLNGDGRDDVVFLLTQETGGSGVFYYVVAALAAEDGYAGSQAVLLGDRIAPQTVEVGADNIVTVNYADRAPGESFATPPSVAKSIRLKLDTDTLQFGEVAQDFEGEADPASMRLEMKTWVWIGASYADGTALSPRQPGVFTLTFGADGAFTAATDCNRLGGTYTAAGSALTFGALRATRMFCEGSQETAFSALLEAVASYRFTSRGQLILVLDADAGSAEFR